jgi:hypothetical protein
MTNGNNETHQTYKTDVSVRVNGTRNWLSSPRKTTSEKLTACLQKSVVQCYEGKHKYWDLNIDNMGLQIIPREYILGFHRRNRDIHIRFSQQFECSSWSNSITSLERPWLMIPSRTGKVTKISDSNTARHISCMESLWNSESTERDIGDTSGGRRSTKIWQDTCKDI